MAGSRFAILRTSCGCERVVLWHGGPGICVAMRSDWSANGARGPESDVATFRARIFRAGPSLGPNGEPVFEEADEECARKPKYEGREFTATEWADAVARFSVGVSGEIHRQVAEFAEVHRMAELIHHESGVLVGAFYPSPLWSHSEDAVAFFSQLLKPLDPR